MPEGKGPDLLEHGRPELPGQVMAHAGIGDQACAGDGSRSRLSGLELDDRVVLAVQDEGGDA
jgi:hypothetical protein